MTSANVDILGVMMAQPSHLWTNMGPTITSQRSQHESSKVLRWLVTADPTLAENSTANESTSCP